MNVGVESIHKMYCYWWLILSGLTTNRLYWSILKDVISNYLSIFRFPMITAAFEWDLITWDIKHIFLIYQILYLFIFGITLIIDKYLKIILHVQVFDKSPFVDISERRLTKLHICHIKFSNFSYSFGNG